MDAEMKEILTQILSRFDQVDKRFDQVDRRFEQVDRRFNQVEERMDGLTSRVDSLSVQQNSLSGQIKDLTERVTTIEETTARTDLRLENEIGPTVQLLLENQVANNSKLDKLPPMEEKLDDVHSRVQVIEDVVTDHSKTIKTYKQAK